MSILSRPPGQEAAALRGLLLAVPALLLPAPGPRAQEDDVQAKIRTSIQTMIQAIEEGMSTLKQDGIHKMFKGVTDIAEVKRVCIV